MRHRVLFLTLSLGFLLTTPLHAQDATTDLFGRINGLRAALGLPAYTFNSALNSAAQQQANWMVASGQVSHFQDDSTGPRARAQAAGYGSPWVSENIYMGSNATPDAAWNFWLNSTIHYKGLTNNYYQEIGIGVAGGNGTAFVLVFGVPARAAPIVISNSAANTASSGPPEQPSFVVGLDEHGHIMHEIQPGDTLGDIALIYGYTWDDIPYMLTINDLGEEAARVLEIGAIFLVPPKAGTFTPTPVPDPSETPVPPTATRSVPTSTVTSTPIPENTASLSPIATTAPTMTAIVVAAAPDNQIVPTPMLTDPVPDEPTGGTPTWLLLLVLVQLGVLLAATVEYVRRLRR